ncbi:LOW QUALITY PROTEIN: baculoviral IAP repeat-containing protein 1-like [Polypterus senegalus]|uniref:LOW QUALITY PROTEIN: baculoviral IAP repeat-containing protein 1-like n=1 Tax=Polypterus senegalus TaxID=55291 RepID=UPI0019640667|nr:LOW QUALITY PROTEIN: baculoviral IAP repeat-containing protein 1-like [Polypterus senegalus]
MDSSQGASDCSPSTSLQSQDANVLANKLDPSKIEALFQMFNIDMTPIVQEMEEEFKEICAQLPQGYNHKMRSEVNRLNTFENLQSHSSYSPEEMAENGFFDTGVKSSIQCFCCGLVLCMMSVRKDPHMAHLESKPDCDFIKGVEVGNIPKYAVKVQRSKPVDVDKASLYSTEEDRLESYKDWPEFSKGDTAALAQAGFYFTGIIDAVQCFCCGGCLAYWEEGDDPWKEHARWFPECKYLQARITQEEAEQFIKDYDGFYKVLAKHYSSDDWMECQVEDTTEVEGIVTSIFIAEDCRLDSLKVWPGLGKGSPTALAKCGFFYSGKGEAVKCIQCGVTITDWEPETTSKDLRRKHSESCPFYTDTSLEGGNMERSSTAACKGEEMCLQDRPARSLEDPPVNAAENRTEDKWLQEAKRLQSELRELYNSAAFRKIFPFPDSPNVSPDLKHVFASLPLVKKNLRNQPVQKVGVPVLLKNLSSITVIEGEAGSGKSALLRRIAILWASGNCPALRRFKLVFHLSLNTSQKDQSLSAMISEQLCPDRMDVSEQFVEETVRKLNNQVLFLLDDCGTMDAIPQCVEQLMLGNHINNTSIVIGIQTHRSAKVRQCASTVLEIGQFPGYSTFFILKKLFSHDLQLVEQFFVKSGLSKTLQEILKTPLFALVICALWIQTPKPDVDESEVFWEYLHLSLKKHSSNLTALGDLALDGIFSSRYEFSREDLTDSGVDENEVLHFGLLSKFTANLLKPVYRFFHCHFQEFVAARRLAEMLQSDSAESQKKGRDYLKQIDTYLQVMCNYKYFLDYACISSPVAATEIVSHVVSYAAHKGFYNSNCVSNKNVEHYLNLFVTEQFFKATLSMGHGEDALFESLLSYVLNIAYGSQCVSSCTPHILKLFTGKSLKLSESSCENNFSKFTEEHPEVLSLLQDLEITLSGNKKPKLPDFYKLEKLLENQAKPAAVEEDFAPVYQPLDSFIEKAEANMSIINKYGTTIKRFLPDSMVGVFVKAANKYTLPVLRLIINDCEKIQEEDLRNLIAILAVTEQVDVSVIGSEGFLENIQSAVDKRSKIFRKITIRNSPLTRKEEELLTAMSALEALDLNFTSIPEYLISNLDKLTCLKEIHLSTLAGTNIFEKMPDGVRNLPIEKLIIQGADLTKEHNKLAFLIRHFPRLKVFHLQCNGCPGFPSIITSLTHCEELENVSFKGFTPTAEDISAFATSLKKFTKLRILTVPTQETMVDKEAAHSFALALGYLKNLEELKFPSSPGMKAAISTAIDQFRYLPHLKVLSMSYCLEDSSLLQLAKATKEGHLEALQKLELPVNNDITDSGWRNFFLTLDRMPHLAELSVSRMYTHNLKPSASTVRAFVQCVSRLPSLLNMVMFGWLLDAEDLNLFDAMKKEHPQSKCLNILWKWVLPFQPVIKQEDF